MPLWFLVPRIMDSSESFARPSTIRVVMEHLLIGDIGAIWAIRDQGGQFVRGCSGQITGTRVGPIRRWDLRLNTEFHPASFSGASYISLPKSLPPSEAESQWLTAEGLRGLVWGGGKWFANQVGPSSLSSQPLRRKRGVNLRIRGRCTLRRRPCGDTRISSW